VRRSTLGVFGALILAGAGAGAALTADTVQPLGQTFCSPVAFSGAGTPRFLVVSDLPLLGRSKQGSVAMTKAIRYVFAQHRYRAGKYSIGYQSCDDSNPQTQSGDLSKCAANAKAYAADPSVIGVIGTWSSTCSEIEVPIANRAPAGPLAMISPTNTDIGLTRAAPGTNPGQPASYYPTGRRSFARVISPDDAQGAAVALLGKQLRVRRMFVIDDHESYGISVSAAFTRAARLLGLQVAGHGSWDPTGTTFAHLGATVKGARVRGVFLAGFACPHCDKLIEALRVALGPDGIIVVSDGFALSDLVASAGAAANGVYGSLLALPAAKLGAAGRAIVRRFGAGAPDSGGPPYAAEAADVLLNAIASSNGSRASVTTHLLGERVHEGILGSFRFDKNGDIDPGGVSIYRVVAGHIRLDRAILVPAHLVH
jgi:branched-chain amino acid transport system substrate-binding protein